MQITKRQGDSNPLGQCPHCRRPIYYKDEFCPACGEKNDSWREIGEDQCGNCHARIDPDDKYCRHCGTRVGEGKYEPYQNLMECIYGPRPEKRTHTCQDCGYSWTTCTMVDSECYCPKCGGFAPYPGYDGPVPVKRTHICQKCGFTWVTNAMVEHEALLAECNCPKCGEIDLSSVFRFR